MAVLHELDLLSRRFVCPRKRALSPIRPRTPEAFGSKQEGQFNEVFEMQSLKSEIEDETALFEPNMEKSLS